MPEPSEPKASPEIMSVVIQMNEAEARRFVDLWEKANSCAVKCQLVQVDACSLNEYQQRIFSAFTRHCPDKVYTGNAIDVDTLMATIEARVPREDSVAASVEIAADAWFKCYGDPQGGPRTRWHITRDYREEDRLWDALARSPRFLERAEHIMALRHDLKVAANRASMSSSQGKRIDVLMEQAKQEELRIKGLEGHDEDTEV
jgi:hypothetical protein